MALNAQQQAHAAQLAALGEHDRIVRATQVPIFRGDLTKDHKAEDWLAFFENAADIAKWNDSDEKIIAQFRALMRDSALQWYNSLSVLPGVDVKVWANVKARFLLHYATKATPKSFCTNFKDLVQKPQERVYDFYARLAAVFIKMKTLVPDSFNTVRIAHDDDIAEAVLASKKEGLADAINFFMEQLLLAGLHERFRTKIQELGTVGLLAVLDKAAELEKLELDNKNTVHSVAAISAISEPFDQELETATGPVEDLAEDEIAAINAIRKNQGRPPFRGKPSGSSGNKSNIQCRYCKKFNHFQRDCKSRQRDGAPMVGADGKPYQPRNPAGGPPKPKPPAFAVKALGNSEEDNEPDVVGYVGSVYAAAPAQPARLNW
jgi:hypothetical protein